MSRKTHIPVSSNPTGKMARRRMVRKRRKGRPDLTPRELQAKAAARKRRYNERQRARLDANYQPRPAGLCLAVDGSYNIENEGIYNATD